MNVAGRSGEHSTIAARFAVFDVFIW